MDEFVVIIADGRETYIAANFEKEEDAKVYADGYNEALNHMNTDGIYAVVQQVPAYSK